MKNSFNNENSINLSLTKHTIKIAQTYLGVKQIELNVLSQHT